MKEKTTRNKPNIFSRMAKGFKEIISELKKVTWPKTPEVVKNTGVVLVVVLFFLVAIGVFDYLLQLLLGLLIG